MSRWQPPEVNADERRLLVLLGLAAFFGQYDEQLLPLLLRHIQQDLGVAESGLGGLGSIIRLGALPAFFALWIADRVGRRAVLLVTIAGYTLCSAATAFSRDEAEFVVFQLLARTFMAAEFLLGLLVVVEEFRPHNRGFGVGVVSLLAVAGRGLALGLFAFVDELPHGWRALYVVGVAPLLVLAFLRRRLPETRRFEGLARRRVGEPARWGVAQPLVGLVTRYPGRFAAVAALSFLWSLSNAPVDFFLPKYAQEVHGWTPADFAVISLAGGALGVTALLLVGWVSDQLGRRPTFAAALLCEPAFGLAMYQVSSLLLPFLYVPWVFASMSNDVVGRTYVNELFPTSHRGTAAGARGVASTLGGAAGLALEGVLFGLLGSHAQSVSVLAAVGFLLPAIVVASLPETSGRTLEAIAPEAPDEVPP